VIGVEPPIGRPSRRGTFALEEHWFEGEPASDPKGDVARVKGFSWKDQSMQLND
jgi:hypothetical protein